MADPSYEAFRYVREGRARTPEEYMAKLGEAMGADMSRPEDVLATAIVGDGIVLDDMAERYAVLASAFRAKGRDDVASLFLELSARIARAAEVIHIPGRE